MIDIHSHMLPGLDDGPRNVEESVAMARMAVDDGIHGVICTPHWNPPMWPNERSDISQAIDEFRLRLQAESIPLEIWPGSELHLDAELPSMLAEGRLSSLNGGSWLLLELPGSFLPRRIDDYLWRLLQLGYQVILAHPERYSYVLRDPGQLHAWVEMGVTVQITSASLLGRLGPEILTLSQLLLAHRLVHFLASDSHGVHSRRPQLREALDAATDIMGREDALRLVEQHPNAVVMNKPLSLTDFAPMPISKKRRFWFNFW